MREVERKTKKERKRRREGEGGEVEERIDTAPLKNKRIV